MGGAQVGERSARGAWWRWSIGCAVLGWGMVAGFSAGPGTWSLPVLQAQEAQPAAKPAAKPESSPEALALYADAAGLQNGGAFDVAVEEWSRFIEKFPKDPLAPKAQHYLGVCLLQLKQFDKAAAAFAAVVKNYPQFELLDDATYNLALSHYSQASPQDPPSYAAALAAFTTHVEKFPKSKLADQALYYQAECRYHQGQKKEAVAGYERVVKNFPESTVRADAAYAWGFTLEELGDAAAAGQAYDQFLQSYKEHPLATEVRLRKAETVLQGGQFAEAEKQFDEVSRVAGFGQADVAALRRAFCLMKLEKYPEAAAAYAAAAEKFPQSSAVHEAELSAGRWYYRADQLSNAAGWLQKALAAGGKETPEAAHWLARIALRERKPADALQVVEKALPQAEKSTFLVTLQMDRADALYEIPERRADALAAYRAVSESHADHELAPTALYNVAYGELDLKQYDAAVRDAQAFLDKYSKHALVPDVAYVRAESQLLANQLAEAEKNYQALVTGHAQHRDAGLWRVRWALSQFLAKKYDAVVTTLAKTEGLMPADLLAEAQYLVGASEFQREKYAEAAAALAASLKTAPRWRQADETLLLLSRTQARRNELDAAKASARQLLQEYPDSRLADQAHYRLGEYAYGAEDYAGALASYEEVVAKYPQSTFAPYALFGKGWSLTKTEQFPAAVAAFTTLLDKFPQHMLVNETRYARGLARRKAGDAKGAIADLDAFLANNPPAEARSHARYERGLAQVAAQDLAGAVTTFEALLKEDEKYGEAANVRYELAWAYKSLDKSAEAVAQFRLLTEAFPMSPLAGEAHLHVAEGLYEQRKFEEAVKDYAAARQKAPPGEIAEKATHKLGWAHFQLKQFQPALEQFTAQLTGYPEGMLAVDARFMKAECLFRLNKYTEAVPAFQEVVGAEGLNDTLRTLGLLHGGQAAGQVKQWKVSVELLGKLLERYPQSPYAFEASYERGWARQNLNELDAAIADYQTAAAARDHVGARARFMMGEVRFGQQKYDEAVRDFQRVMFGFGGEKAPAEVKTWQAKAGFEAGRCWDVRIEKAKDAAERTQALTNARKLYGYVVEKHPQDPLAADARKRLDALK
ncbi:MAG: tetratricopeptide repeat protein [Pirellulales bacterium]